MKPQTVALVGCGFWGKKLYSALRRIEDVKVLVCDSDPNAMDDVKDGPVAQYMRYEDVLTHPEVNAIILATPLATHVPMAVAAIDAKKHVFVEKPLTLDLAECEMLADRAAANDVRLMVGYIYLHNPYVRRMRELIEDGHMGEVKHIACERSSYGLMRKDVDVLWDMAIHDVSIMSYLVDRPVVAVRASGRAIVNDIISDIGTIDMRFAGAGTWCVEGHVRASRVDAVRRRSVTVVGSKRMVVFDETATNPLVSYTTGTDLLVERHLDKVHSSSPGHPVSLPVNILGDPITEELAKFIYAIQNPCVDVISDAVHSMEITRIMQAVDESVSTAGAWCDL